MTETKRKIVAENPEEFLKKCFYHELQIKGKLELIRHYKELAESITAEIKETPTFNLAPSNKIEKYVLEIVNIEEDIEKEIIALREDIALVQEVINVLDKPMQKVLMEARYLKHKKWKEIALSMNFSCRRVQQFHKEALQKISQHFV